MYFIKWLAFLLSFFSLGGIDASPKPNGLSEETYLEMSSMIFGLTKMANESNSNAECFKQLKHVRKAILAKEPWAMKVLDASGTKPSGFVFGHNYWLGSRETCRGVQKPVDFIVSPRLKRIMFHGILTESSPFDMDYKVIYLRHNSPWQMEIKLMSERIIHIGLCLPSSCRPHEIQTLTADYLASGLFVENGIYEMRPQVLYTKDLKLSDSFYQKRTFKVLRTFVLFTAAMMICASFLRAKPTSRQGEAVKKAVNGKLQQVPEETSMPASGSTVESGCTLFRAVTSLVRSYDLNANWHSLFAIKENVPNDISIIFGLRSISAFWVLYAHVLFYAYFVTNNKAFLIILINRSVGTAFWLVDALFAISGFCQTYQFLRNLKQMETIRRNSFRGNVKMFFKMLLRRYLRLAPLYISILGMAELFYAYNNDVSVYHFRERFDETCSHNWWRNLLFIQNFYHFDDMCINWSWSLACEMQFFIVATFLLFVYAKNPQLVKTLVIAAFVGCITWTVIVGLDVKFELSFDVAYVTITPLYISPFIRMLPYLMGTMTAWCLIEKRSQLDASDTTVKCLWNFSGILFVFCITPIGRIDTSIMPPTTWLVLGRLFISLSTCLMILGSGLGSRSWWSRFLDWKVFQHFNRLTYAIYLLNPFVIALIFSSISVSTNADPFLMFILTAGFAVIVYVASIVFSLAFEMPYSNWSMLIQISDKKKSN